jgi:hypothetical protein
MANEWSQDLSEDGASSDVSRSSMSTSTNCFNNAIILVVAWIIMGTCIITQVRGGRNPNV